MHLQASNDYGTWSILPSQGIVSLSSRKGTSLWAIDQDGSCRCQVAASEHDLNADLVYTAIPLALRAALALTIVIARLQTGDSTTLEAIKDMLHEDSRVCSHRKAL